MGIISGPGSLAVQFGDHLRSWDHLRTRTELLDLLEVYKNASGLTINCTKTEVMWIGSLRNNKTKPLGLKRPDEPIKALGVYYSYDEKLLREKNFIENLDKIKKTC